MKNTSEKILNAVKRHCQYNIDLHSKRIKELEEDGEMGSEDWATYCNEQVLYKRVLECFKHDFEIPEIIKHINYIPFCEEL